MDIVQQECTYRDHFNLYRLPNEMWIAVFEAMEKPSDLLKVTKTCKHFYALAVRVLYRNLQWMSPFPFASNTNFWRKQGNTMADVPTSLVVGISHINPNSFARFDPTAAVVETDGTWNISSSHNHNGMALFHQHQNYMLDNASDTTNSYSTDIRRLSFFASRGMYETLCSMICSFSMLQELVFHHAELPDIIYSAIKSLPRLRHLAIQYCSLPLVRHKPDATFADLPITELILWCSKADSDQTPTSNYVYALNLCTARNLRVLKVDWTAVTARFFALTNPYVQAVLPDNIQDLTLRMPVSKLWPSEGDASRSMLINPLIRFLDRSSTIQRLTIYNRLPSLDLEPTMLPNLVSYTGPLATVLAVLKDRPVNRLEISDVDKKLSDFVSLLPDVAKIKPQLQTLCFMMREWDDEILHAIYQLFTDLRRIKIKYEDRFPSEYTLLSLGARFLYRFPLLESMQLYQPGHPVSILPQIEPSPGADSPMIPYPNPKDQGPGAAADEEVIGLIIPWQKHCRHLREVQLVEGVIWRRAFDGDEWCKRHLQPFDKLRELVG